MQDNERISSIAARLDKMTIYEVRQVAREVKASVTSGQKANIIDAVLSLAKAETEPAQPSLRGAPPKSDKYDEELVGEILECRRYYLALKNGEERSFMEVNSPDVAIEKEFTGFLHLDKEASLFCGNEKAYIGELFLSRYCLREGDKIHCKTISKSGALYAGVSEILSINGESATAGNTRKNFNTLTHLYPEKRINLFCGDDISLRMVDLFCPLAFGQRALILSPANGGKTTLLKSIARGICANYRDLAVIILLVSARPEEVNDFKKSDLNSELFTTDFLSSEEDNLRAVNLAFGYAKRLAEKGRNAVILADGLIDSSLDEEVKKACLYSAINAEEGGSVTVATTTGGDVSAFRGAANMVVSLSERLAKERVFPAIDILNSFTCGEEKLLSAGELEAARILRAKVMNGGNAEEIINYFATTSNNAELVGTLKNGR